MPSRGGKQTWEIRKFNKSQKEWLAKLRGIFMLAHPGKIVDLLNTIALEGHSSCKSSELTQSFSLK